LLNSLIMGNVLKLGRLGICGAVWLSVIGFGIAGCASRPFTIESAQAAAEKGDAKAEYFLAVHYAKGEGVPRDDAKAAQYMTRAAEGGYAFAQNDLGAWYTMGQGVPQDPVEAAKWFRKAAEQGDPLGEYSLGFAYVQGNGVPKNIPEGIEWYKKAVKQNQPDAAATLGDFYLLGSATTRPDYHQAFESYQIGAKVNNAACLNGLGNLYQQGRGVGRDPRKAAQYYQAAGKAGFARAYSNLGEMYLDGVLMKEDFVEAYKWFTLGANAGDSVARHYLSLIDLKHPLSEDQKEEAYRRVHEYELQLNEKSGRPATLPTRNLGPSSMEMKNFTAGCFARRRRPPTGNFEISSSPANLLTSRRFAAGLFASGLNRPGHWDPGISRRWYQ
jgi:TPR repeat protein